MIQNEPYEKVINKFKELEKESGLSAYQFRLKAAEFIGIDVSAIYRWMNNEAEPKSKNYLKLVQFINERS